MRLTGRIAPIRRCSPSVAGIGDPGRGVVIWETGINDSGYNYVASLLTDSAGALVSGAPEVLPSASAVAVLA